MTHAARRRRPACRTPSASPCLLPTLRSSCYSTARNMLVSTASSWTRTVMSTANAGRGTTSPSKSPGKSIFAQQHGPANLSILSLILNRTKSKIKTIQTLQQVNLLKAENDFLNRKVDILSRELRILKDIFVSHASSAHGTRMTEYDLTVLTGSHALDPHAPAYAPVSTYGRDCHSPEAQLYLPSSSHHRYPASLSLSSGSSIQDSEDDL